MRLLTILILIFTSSLAFAQQNDRERDRRRSEQWEKLKSARIAFLTTRLQLEPETAQEFWPIFNEYENRKDKLGDQYNQRKRDLVSETGWRNISDENANKMLDIYVEQKQAELDLEKEYLQKFRKVLDTRQVWMVIRIDSDFRRSLMKRLSEEDNKGRRDDEDDRRGN